MAKTRPTTTRAMSQDSALSIAAYASDQTEAMMIESFLESHGIQVHIPLDRHLLMDFGIGSSSGAPTGLRVQVATNQLEAARELLKAHKAAMDSGSLHIPTDKEALGEIADQEARRRELSVVDNSGPPRVSSVFTFAAIFAGVGSITLGSLELFQTDPGAPSIEGDGSAGLLGIVIGFAFLSFAFALRRSSVRVPNTD